MILQTLAGKAGMEVINGASHGKRIRFHCMRKFLIDRLSAYASESQWKQIVGKSIEEGAYVSQDQLRGVFTRAMKDLLINGNGIKAKKLIELENALLDSQRKISALETTNQVLRQRLDEMENTQKTMQKTIMNMDARLNALEEVERKRPEKKKEWD